MKRIAILVVAGLIVGLAGGVGASVALGRGAAVKADSAVTVAHDSTAAATAADSARVQTPPADSAAVDSTTENRVHGPTRGDRTVDAAKTSGVPNGATAGRGATSVNAGRGGGERGPAPGIVTAVVPRDTTPRTDTARVGRLARLFAAMPARDAARVMLQLDDADAQLVLSAMDNRHAAEILSNFPADRAAAMSRLTLRPSRP